MIDYHIISSVAFLRRLQDNISSRVCQRIFATIFNFAIAFLIRCAIIIVR